MAKVHFLNRWAQRKPQDLQDFLTPAAEAYGGGSVERAASDARAACDAMGRLLTYMVENYHMSVEEAAKIAGVDYEDVDRIEQ